MIILYTTHCPKCKILENKLKSKNITYITEEDVEKMLSLGMSEVPYLQVGKEFFDFGAAVRWINNY